jgi:hypothetical protein
MFDILQWVPQQPNYPQVNMTWPYTLWTSTGSDPRIDDLELEVRQLRREIKELKRRTKKYAIELQGTRTSQVMRRKHK